MNYKKLLNNLWMIIKWVCVLFQAIVTVTVIKGSYTPSYLNIVLLELVLLTSLLDMAIKSKWGNDDDNWHGFA